MAKAPITQEKIKARKRKKFFWLAFGSVAGVLLIVSILSFVSSLDFFQVKNIQVSSGSNKEVAEAEGIVEKDLGGEKFWFFPHSDIFFVSVKKISQDIANSVSNAGKVSVSKELFGTITVNIEDKTPVALWCLYDSCLDIEANGVAFAKAESTSSLVVFKNGSTPTIGAAPLSADKFVPLLIFINDLPQREIFASSVTINQDGTDNIYVGTSTSLVVDPSKDLSQALSNLDRILEDKNSGISVSTLSSLRYIDLRFPDKIFYK